MGETHPVTQDEHVSRVLAAERAGKVKNQGIRHESEGRGCLLYVTQPGSRVWHAEGTICWPRGRRTMHARTDGWLAY